ncbi:MAG: hypothetical protein KKE23_02825 [Nanoarchaeota archaeon]|nr:hypothetical protein [Nanoarchaeota archaeon]
MKHQKLKSKKAQVLPESLILLAAIAICAYSLYIAYSFEADYSDKLSVPQELIQAYNSQDNFELYAKDAAKLSVEEAFSNILKSNFLNILKSNPDCRIIPNENIPIWSSDCVSKNKVNEEFLTEINSKFKELLNSDRKYKIALGDKIQFEFEPFTLNISGENYSGTYQYQTLFSVENPLKETPEAIYSRVAARMKDCNNSEVYDICINKMVLTDYTINCASGKYLICSLKTKKNYFFNGSFGKVESKFAVNF